MPIPISAGVRQLLEAPNYMHLSTLRTDGSPRNWVVSVGLEDDQIPICTTDRAGTPRTCDATPALRAGPNPRGVNVRTCGPHPAAESVGGMDSALNEPSKQSPTVCSSRWDPVPHHLVSRSSRIAESQRRS